MTMIDPNDTYELVPARDKDRPGDQQRRLVFRNMNCRQWKAAVNTLDSLDKSESAIDAIDKVVNALTVSLVDWHGVLDENGKMRSFSPEDIDLVINEKEAVELLTRTIQANGLTPEQLKKSDAQLASDQESPAQTAAIQGSAEISPP